MIPDAIWDFATLWKSTFARSSLLLIPAERQFLTTGKPKRQFYASVTLA